MPNVTLSRGFATAAMIAFAVGVQSATASAQTAAERPQFPPPSPERHAPGVESNLNKFDVLDFEFFSNQKWDRFHESHAQDIIVTWPDGHETKGIDKHLGDLKALFVYAPDIQIKVHPDRPALRDRHGDHRPLGERTYGSRMALLGRRRFHEAALTREVTSRSQR